MPPVIVACAIAVALAVVPFPAPAWSWTQLGLDIDAESAADLSGNAVALSKDGTRVAIGGQGNDGGGSHAGHVRVYELNGKAWAQIGADINSGSAGNRSS